MVITLSFLRSFLQSYELSRNPIILELEKLLTNLLDRLDRIDEEGTGTIIMANKKNKQTLIRANDITIFLYQCLFICHYPLGNKGFINPYCNTANPNKNANPEECGTHPEPKA